MAMMSGALPVGMDYGGVDMNIGFPGQAANGGSGVQRSQGNQGNFEWWGSGANGSQTTGDVRGAMMGQPQHNYRPRFDSQTTGNINPDSSSGQNVSRPVQVQYTHSSYASIQPTRVTGDQQSINPTLQSNIFPHDVQRMGRYSPSCSQPVPLPLQQCPPFSQQPALVGNHTGSTLPQQRFEYPPTTRMGNREPQPHAYQNGVQIGLSTQNIGPVNNGGTVVPSFPHLSHQPQNTGDEARTYTFATGNQTGVQGYSGQQNHVHQPNGHGFNIGNNARSSGGQQTGDIRQNDTGQLTTIQPTRSIQPAQNSEQRLEQPRQSFNQQTIGVMQQNTGTTLQNNAINGPNGPVYSAALQQSVSSIPHAVVPTAPITGGNQRVGDIRPLLVPDPNLDMGIDRTKTPRKYTERGSATLMNVPEKMVRRVKKEIRTLMVSRYGFSFDGAFTKLDSDVQDNSTYTLYLEFTKKYGWSYPTCREILIHMCEDRGRNWRRDQRNLGLLPKYVKPVRKLNIQQQRPQPTAQVDPAIGGSQNGGGPNHAGFNTGLSDRVGGGMQNTGNVLGARDQNQYAVSQQGMQHQMQPQSQQQHGHTGVFGESGVGPQSQQFGQPPIRVGFDATGMNQGHPRTLDGQQHQNHEQHGENPQGRPMDQPHSRTHPPALGNGQQHQYVHQQSVVGQQGHSYSLGQQSARYINETGEQQLRYQAQMPPLDRQTQTYQQQQHQHPNTAHPSNNAHQGLASVPVDNMRRVNVVFEPRQTIQGGSTTDGPFQQRRVDEEDTRKHPHQPTDSVIRRHNGHMAHAQPTSQSMGGSDSARLSPLHLHSAGRGGQMRDGYPSNGNINLQGQRWEDDGQNLQSGGNMERGVDGRQFHPSQERTVIMHDQRPQYDQQHRQQSPQHDGQDTRRLDGEHSGYPATEWLQHPPHVHQNQQQPITGGPSNKNMHVQVNHGLHDTVPGLNVTQSHARKGNRIPQVHLVRQNAIAMHQRQLEQMGGQDGHDVQPVHDASGQMEYGASVPIGSGTGAPPSSGNSFRSGVTAISNIRSGTSSGFGMRASVPGSMEASRESFGNRMAYSPPLPGGLYSLPALSGAGSQPSSSYPSEPPSVLLRNRPAASQSQYVVPDQQVRSDPSGYRHPGSNHRSLLPLSDGMPAMDSGLLEYRRKQLERNARLRGTLADHVTEDWDASSVWRGNTDGVNRNVGANGPFNGPAGDFAAGDVHPGYNHGHGGQGDRAHYLEAGLVNASGSSDLEEYSSEMDYEEEEYEDPRDRSFDPSSNHNTSDSFVHGHLHDQPQSHRVYDLSSSTMSLVSDAPSGFENSQRSLRSGRVLGGPGGIANDYSRVVNGAPDQTYVGDGNVGAHGPVHRPAAVNGRGVVGGNPMDIRESDMSSRTVDNNPTGSSSSIGSTIYLAMPSQGTVPLTHASFDGNQGGWNEPRRRTSVGRNDLDGRGSIPSGRGRGEGRGGVMNGGPNPRAMASLATRRDDQQRYFQQLENGPSSDAWDGTMNMSGPTY